MLLNITLPLSVYEPMIPLKSVFICALALGFALTGSPVFSAEPRADVIARELPKLQTDYRATALQPLGAETALSREYYQLLNRYVRFGTKNFRDWPAEPGAKFHKRDGHREHDIRQNASVALAYALLSKFGDFDEKLAGRSRADVKADVVALLRYLAITHTNNFLPTGSKLAWGNHWQSAYWTRIAGEAAWLVWDDLPDDTKVMVARMIIHEANRYNTRPPDDGEWVDTKSEENAWNSEIIVLAACMFQNHPNAALWRERAIVYMMNAYSTKADHSDDRMIDGRRVRDWVTTVTIHSDYTLENHRLVHPDYMSAFNLNLHNTVLYRLGGLKIPDATYHHVMDTYHVLEHLTSTNGPHFYINGQDWWPHRPDNALEFGGFLSVLKQDRNAAFLERAALKTNQKMHGRFEDGRQYDSWEFNYPNPEEDNMALYSDLYLAHRFFGDHSAPASAEEYQRSQADTRIFEAGGFVTHRTAEKFVSFTWVNGAMGLIFPAGDTWFTSPYEWSMVGRISVAGKKDSQPKVEQHTVRKLKISGPNDGFAFVGRISRCEGAVEQRIAMISLPGQPVLYVEQLRAVTNVNVAEVGTARFAMFNEDDNLLEDNERLVWTADGAHVMRGAIREPAREHVWKTTWANLDGRLHVVAKGSGQMAYQENHKHERARLHQTLSANYLAEVGNKRAGEIFSEAVVGWLPNSNHKSNAELKVQRIGPDGFDVQFGSWRVLVNLGDKPMTADALTVPPLNAEVQVSK